MAEFSYSNIIVCEVQSIFNHDYIAYNSLVSVKIQCINIVSLEICVLFDQEKKTSTNSNDHMLAYINSLSTMFKSMLTYSISTSKTKLSGLTAYTIKALHITSNGIIKLTAILQKQLFKRVPRRRWSENMQQIYRRTPMSKYDFP